jgi:anaerobic selenocysteine-containing dehydrogenase
MSQRTVKTVCNLCGLSGCGMKITVQDGKVVQVKGDKDHPENRGALCIKGQAVIDILYAPDRLKYPLRRVGQRGEGKWERITWDEALEQHLNTSQAIRAVTALMAVTGNLDARGGNVILSPVSLAKNSVTLHDRLPPEVDKRRLGNEFPLTQFEFTKLAHPPSGFKAVLKETPYPVKAMLIMAANPALTCPNSPEVTAALEKLAFLAVVDIFMTQTAELADVVLPACTFLEQTYYATHEAGPYLKPMRNIRCLRRRMPQNVAEIHPVTAADCKVRDGATVLVESPHASVKCQVRVSADILPRVVQLFHGFGEANANLLTDNGSCDPITGSVPARSTLCRIAKA